MIDDDSLPPKKVGAKVALGVGGLVSILVGVGVLVPYSANSQHRRQVENALLNYSFPPQNKQLADLLPAPVSDIEVDGDCSTGGKRFGPPLRSFSYGPTSCETRAVTVVTTTGQRYTFNTSGLFSVVTFVPADAPTKELVYAGAVPSQGPLHSARAQAEWLAGFRKSWPATRFSVIDRISPVSEEDDGRIATVTLVSATKEELCYVVTNWDVDMYGLLEGAQASVHDNEVAGSKKEPSRTLASARLGPPVYVLRKLRIYFLDREFLATSGSRLVETALSLYVPEHGWTKVASKAAARVKTLWDRCLGKASSGCGEDRIHFEEVGEAPWWPPIELAVQNRMVEVRIESSP